MPQAFPLKNLVSVDSHKSVDFKTIAVQFGDGYEQRAPSGLNSRVESFGIKWANLTKANCDTVVAALDAVGGWDYLTLTPHGEATAKKYKIKDGQYSVSWSTPNESTAILYTVSCSLEQVF